MPLTYLKYFKDEPFLLVSASQHLYNRSIALCQSAGFEPIVYLTTPYIHTIFNMTVLGIGISFIPHNYIKYGNLENHATYYYFDSVHSIRDLIIAYKKNHYLSKAVRKFISIMKKFMSNNKDNE